MNFVDATVHPGDRSLRASGFALDIPERFADADLLRRETKVVMGVRPEHVRPSTGTGSPPFAFTVDMVEPLGHEVVVHGRAGGDSMVAKLGADHVPEVGSSIQLSVDADRVLLFDPGSGIRLGG
jgi:multiple sugar transport system ATP-binding protein